MAFLGAIGAIASGVMGFAQSSYQAKVAQMNASIAKDNAKRAIDRSEIAQQDSDIQTAAVQGTQLAMQGASGISINSESSRRIRKATAVLGRLDSLNIRQGGEIEKYNYLVEASNQEAAGKMAQLGGIGSLLGGFINGAGSLVGRSTATASPYTVRPYDKPRMLA